MKILFIAHDSLKGGSGRCLYELLCQIKSEDGIEPIVLVHNRNTLYEAVKKLGFEAYYCRFGYTCTINTSRWKFLFWKYVYRNLANIWAYLFLCIKTNVKSIDIIHSNSMIIDFGAFLHRRTGKPLVWHLREFGEKHFGYRSFYPSLPDYMTRNANKIIAVSKVLVKEFIENGGDSNKIECVYDGVVGVDYENRNKSQSDDLLRIVMTGRLSLAKGQIYAIEAVKRLPNTVKSKIQLDFYGAGEDEQFLKQKVSDYHLNDVIHFRGFSNNVGKVLSEYDVGLILSKCEGFGRTTVEYMLSELCVIGSNSGATPEILCNGKYGTLVPYGDSLALAEEIEKMVTNKNYFKVLAKNARFFAQENFCIEKNYKKIIQTIVNNSLEQVKNVD